MRGQTHGAVRLKRDGQAFGLQPFGERLCALAIRAGMGN
jgi:hypothetical protein